MSDEPLFRHAAAVPDAEWRCYDEDPNWYFCVGEARVATLVRNDVPLDRPHDLADGEVVDLWITSINHPREDGWSGIEADSLTAGQSVIKVSTPE